MIPLGGLVTLAVLLPNLLMILRPPVGEPAAPDEPPSRREVALGLLERIGQAGSFIIPFAYPLEVRGATGYFAFGGMIVALAVYYACWARFLMHGRLFVLLFAPFGGLPLPMALAPVAYFLAAAVLLASVPLGVAATALGVGHTCVSWRTWSRCRAESRPA